MGDPVEADIFEVDASPGDVLLLCSDGLWEPLSDPALGAIMAAPDPLGVALTLRMRCGAGSRWDRQCDDDRGSLAPHAIR